MSWSMPLIPPPRVIREGDVPDIGMGHDELWYDYNTMTYKTASSEMKIQELQKQIEEKKKARDESVKSIIGYFYKSR